MKYINKEYLRQSPVLLWFLLTLRRMKTVLTDTSLEIREKQKFNTMISHRKNIIETYFRQHSVIKLNLGTGIYPLDGWLNSDLEPVSDDIFYLDAINKFPFDDQTIDYVYAEHMIEHISYPQALSMLSEIGRVLKHGGKIRLATPDVRVVPSLLDDNKSSLAQYYIETYARELLGLYSPDLSRFQQHEPRWRINYQHIIKYFPNPGCDASCFVVNLLFYGFGHQFLYDAPTLEAALLQNGYRNINWTTPGISNNEHLRDIERHGRRFSNKINLFETMVVEAEH